jgi:hypothetical protein
MISLLPAEQTGCGMDAVIARGALSPRCTVPVDAYGVTSSLQAASFHETLETRTMPAVATKSQDKSTFMIASTVASTIVWIEPNS